MVRAELPAPATEPLKAASQRSDQHYSIGTAARLADVPIETVRIWERRYDVLRPGRSEGGHRLYSDQDVSLLRAARFLIEQGLRPANVFRLGRQGLIELAELKRALPPTDWADAVIDAAVRLDDSAVVKLLDGALVNRSFQDAALGFWLPVLARVGLLWEQGSLPIAAEHFLQQHVSSRVQGMLRATPAPSGGPVALCACAPGDRHEVGLAACALALKSAGFSVVMLGTDLPALELEQSANVCRPDLVVLSIAVQLAPDPWLTLPTVLERAPLLHLPLLIGGANAHELHALLRRPHRLVRDLGSVVAAARDSLPAALVSVR